MLGAAVLYALVGLFHFIFRRKFLAISLGEGDKVGNVKLWDFLFYTSFGFVVTSSVAIAGVLLVFSYLIVPSVAAMLFSHSIGKRLAIGWSMGTVEIRSRPRVPAMWFSGRRYGADATRHRMPSGAVLSDLHDHWCHDIWLEDYYERGVDGRHVGILLTPKGLRAVRDTSVLESARLAAVLRCASAAWTVGIHFSS